MTTGPQTNMDELQMQKQGRRLVFQIFPEPVSDSVKTMCGWEQEKKRLPSIIVEATEATELAEDEGGALRWPPQGQVSFDEEEDPFVDQSVPSTSDNIRKKNEKDMSGKKGAAKCRCAQSVEPGQLDFSRLTPPSSPTDSEAMPACLRSPPGSRREGRLSQLRQGAAVCGVSSPRTWSIPLPALPTWLAQLPESDVHHTTLSLLSFSSALSFFIYFSSPALVHSSSLPPAPDFGLPLPLLRKCSRFLALK
ncbi:uncharacterized protein LOC114792746 isoform X3 [Denticeps clupeoides]|uniref:uncharacterized protein LOC114792746 isoform X3 n=1 Tax=Denticeps clupeoides TaxID=299321 RepID=UPI0010A2FB37|nr:uncharacterized protein LOC114792746 isoform X3 [Denticeps clupeoides]